MMSITYFRARGSYIYFVHFGAPQWEQYRTVSIYNSGKFCSTVADKMILYVYRHWNTICLRIRLEQDFALLRTIRLAWSGGQFVFIQIYFLRYVEFVTGELSIFMSGNNIVNMKIRAYGSKALILSALIHLVFCRNGKRHMFSMETCKELDCLLRFHVTAYGKHICMKFTY